MTASENTAVYVYCVVHAARRPRAVRLPDGLPEGTRPELTLVTDGLFLVTSIVPLDTYGPSQLESRLRQLDWVSEIAVAHESVVEHFARQRAATVVPVKMFTMFSSMEKALQDVGGRRRAIARAARRIAGCEEWGIRIMRAPTGSSRAGTSSASSPSASGTAFLAARRDARNRAQAARQASRAAADAAFTKLRRLARAAHRRPVREEPGTNPPILEAAFLVTGGGRARFKAEARRQAALCAAAGAAMSLTGPWPAYTFVQGAEQAE